MWSDKETHQDCLGYSTYVQVLASVCTHKDLAPLTLGIFGPWGSGKTSLMEMLRLHIEANKGTKKRKTLWFNAWMYEGSDEARSALIHRMSQRELKDLSQMFNPKIRGWVNYYGRYYPTALWRTFAGLNRRLVRWTRGKYKRYRISERRATHWLHQLAQQSRGLFAHWQLGIVP